MNAAHWHLVLNHIPVMGIAFGIPFLLIGLVKKSEGLIRSAFWVFIVVALLSIPVFLTGEPAAEIVEKIPGISKALIEEHEEAAETALIGVLLLGVLSAIGLVVHRMKKQIGRITVTVVFICSVVVMILMAGAANKGGEIRHSEIRTSPVPSAGPDISSDQSDSD